MADPPLIPHCGGGGITYSGRLKKRTWNQGIIYKKIQIWGFIKGLPPVEKLLMSKSARQTDKLFIRQLSGVLDR